MAHPPSSPRLPSPPPAAENQIAPNSPASSTSTLAQQQLEQQLEQTVLDANAKRRIHPGTSAADFAVGPPLVPLNELDSAFQLQEHLAALHYFHTASNTEPIGRETARQLAQAPPGVDRTLWIYELCRFLIAQCNGLIVGFLFDTPPCSAATCPEMRASEWQFLCAVHEQPKSCCAIDYCCHTLDWAANVVTSPKIFPSRFVFAGASDRNAALKSLVNIFRRLHRIFAHAWFQHRGVFWSVEGQTGLYVLFKTVCDTHDLLPAENYKLPPEAEGLETTTSTTAAADGASPPTNGHDDAAAPVPGLLSMAALADRKVLGAAAPGGRRPSADGGFLFDYAGSSGSGDGAAGAGHASSDEWERLQAAGRTNTRRHIRSSPSTGSAVTTVLEQDEDAHGSPAGRLFASRSAAAHHGAPPAITIREHADENADDETEAASVTVIVHHEALSLLATAESRSGAADTPGETPTEAAPDVVPRTETETEAAPPASADADSLAGPQPQSAAPETDDTAAGSAAEADASAATEPGAAAEAAAETPETPETPADAADAPAGKDEAAA